MRIVRTIQNIWSETLSGGRNIWNESDDGFPERPGMVLNLNASSRVKCAERKRERERGGGEKGGAETREICAGFVDPAVGPQKDEICFHFHLWQPAKISSGPISSLQTVIRLRQYFFPPSFPLLSIFFSFLPLSLYRPPIWIFRIQAKVRLPLYLYLY